MKKINKFGYILIGIIFAMFIGTTPISASTNYVAKQLTAYFLPEEKIISIFADGKQFTQDANGNKYKPFIIDGTMYLPVKDVANLLGKEVQWFEDQSSLSFKDTYLASPDNSDNVNATLTTIIDNNGDRQDKLTYKFTLDEEAVGQWKMFHYYNSLNDFTPALTPIQNFDWTGNTLQPDGTLIMHNSHPESGDFVSKWTNGYFVSARGMSGVPAYKITTIGDRMFMVLEWKSGDYARNGSISYYVFEKIK
jgi:hypothetical protein